MIESKISMGFFSRSKKRDTHEDNVNVSTMGIVWGGDKLTTPQGQSINGFQCNPYVRRACDLYGVFVSLPDTLVFDRKGQQIEDPNHPLIKFLNYPNPLMGRNELMTKIGADLGTFGETFLYPVKTIKGVVRLYHFSPANVTVQETGDEMNPVKMWMISRGANGIMTVAPEDIIHIKLNSTEASTVRGCSPIISSRKSIEMQNAIREWNIAMTKNGAKGSTVIEVPRQLTDQQFERLSGQLQSKHAGASNAGKTMVLDDGKHAVQMGMTAVEMDYVNGTAISAREVSIAYGIAPEVLGDSQNKTYANMGEAYRQTIQTTAVPLLKIVYDALERYLLPFFPDVGEIMYDVEQINDLMGDQVETYTALEGASYLTPNEKREKLGYEPIQDPVADTLLVPMGAIPIGEMGEPLINGDDADILKVDGNDAA